MAVFRINLGEGNRFWQESQEQRVITFYIDYNVFDPLIRGDLAAVRDALRKNSPIIRGHEAAENVVGRWANLLPVFERSDGDLWLHRQGQHLWWATCEGGYAVDRRFRLMENSGVERDVVMLKKQTHAGWSNRSRTNHELTLFRLHPQARRVLNFQGTFDRLSDQNASYFEALIAGGDVRRFYDLPDWKETARAAGWRPQPNVPTVDKRWHRLIHDICQIVVKTVAQSGQSMERMLKDKQLRLTEVELELLIRRLLIEQNERCAYTGLAMLDGSQEPTYLRMSLDRIDSGGHYEDGNLQLVCRFINRMKSDLTDREFREYVHLLRSCPGPLVST